MATQANPPEHSNVFRVLGQVAFVVVAALFVYGFVAVTKDGETRRVCSAACYLHPDYLAAERRAPPFSLKDMQGKAISLESLKGSVVVLNFWSKTCGPCLEEMPELAEFTKVIRDRRDVVVLTVSTDEGPEDVQPTLQTVLREPPPFSVLFDSDQKVSRDKYGSRLVPETWFIDKNGIVRARFDGARDWTNPLFVNFVDALRAGDYCPVRIDARSLEGRAGRICEEMTGG